MNDDDHTSPPMPHNNLYAQLRDYETPNQQVLEPNMDSPIILPQCLNVDASSNIANVGVLEFIIVNYKLFSNHEDRDDDNILQNIIWLEVISALKKTTLPSPLQNKNFFGTIMKTDLIDCFKYFDRCGRRNSGASKHRQYFYRRYQA
jgi:hypothetical protein